MWLVLILCLLIFWIALLFGIEPEFSIWRASIQDCVHAVSSADCWRTHLGSHLGRRQNQNKKYFFHPLRRDEKGKYKLIFFLTLERDSLPLSISVSRRLPNTAISDWSPPRHLLKQSFLFRILTKHLFGIVVVKIIKNFTAICAMRILLRLQHPKKGLNLANSASLANISERSLVSFLVSSSNLVVQGRAQRWDLSLPSLPVGV